MQANLSRPCARAHPTPDPSSEATLTSTECAMVHKAATLAVDLLLNDPEATNRLPRPGLPSHKAGCHDHLRLLKAKLNTLGILHQIGMCHGTVNHQHFFPPQENETACRWRHSENTAFYQDHEFDAKCIDDLVQASVDHIPEAHKEAVLEQSTIAHASLEHLAYTLNNPEHLSGMELSNLVDQIVTKVLHQLEQDNHVFGDDQQRRSDLWIQDMLPKTIDDSKTVFTHPSSPTHPLIKEWRIPKESTKQFEQLTHELDTELIHYKTSSAPSKVLAWTCFEENKNQVIRAAFSTSNEHIQPD